MMQMIQPPVEGREELLQAALGAKQQRYAGNRLAQFKKIAALLGGDFQQAVGQQDMSDPLAAFRALSGKFAEQSKAQGVQDPRALLQQLLMRARGGGGGRFRAE